MRHRPRRSARVALGCVKLAVLGTMTVAGLAATPAPPGPPSDYAGFPVDDRPTHVQRLMDSHDCSVTGWAGEIDPRSAIVRSAAGHLRRVSFTVGWRVYTRHGAALLVAVCLDEAPVQD